MAKKIGVRTPFKWGELVMIVVLVAVWLCLTLVVKQIQAEVEVVSFLKIIIKILALPILYLVGHVIFDACRRLFLIVKNFHVEFNWRLIKRYSLIGLAPMIMIGCGYFISVSNLRSQDEVVVEAKKVVRKPAPKKPVVVDSRFFQWPVPKKPVVAEKKVHQRPAPKKRIVAKVSKPSKSRNGKRAKKIVRNNIHDAYVVSSCAKYGVDVELVRAMIHIESRGNELAVSPAGAGGVMQLMPPTAKQYGVRDVHDPRQNIDGGVKYVKYLLDLFKNDYRLALAGFNAGEGNVATYKGIPPFKETRDYVHDVMKLYRSLVKKRQIASNG
jgi:hypothetical protein